MNAVAQLKPHLSEKSFALSQKHNVYVFDVPTSVNKITVKTAVEAQFKVDVTNVRIVVVKGKAKKSYQKRNRPVDGKRADKKHAFVTVAKGGVIPFFEAEESKNPATKESVPKQNVKSKTEAPKSKGLRQVLRGTARKTQSKGGDK